MGTNTWWALWSPGQCCACPAQGGGLLGGWGLRDGGSLRVPSLFTAGIYILIAVGAVMMFVGFLGCYGAIQESQCLLGTVRSWAGHGAGWGPARGQNQELGASLAL